VFNLSTVPLLSDTALDFKCGEHTPRIQSRSCAQRWIRRRAATVPGRCERR